MKKEINEGTRRWEEYPRLMDWQNQFYQNGCTTKTNLYVQCNPHQNSNDILHRDIKINPKVYMETQKTSNSQANLA
jgi:hypothetical protein